MSMSGLLGIVASMLLDTMYGDDWALCICYVFTVAGILFLFRTLSNTEIVWLSHVFFASFIGFVSSLTIIQPGFRSLFDNTNTMLLNIAILAIIVLGTAATVGLIKEIYEISKP